ncbi:MAG TPA: hypothetical protein VN408_10315 [Actinoplanes sp.]|nr:hypothetical protein [Actinoplanes sp.]
MEAVMVWRGRVEVFRGRTMVTYGPDTNGVAVGDDVSDTGLGEVIIAVLRRTSGTGASCEEVAGVPPEEYRPEKSAWVEFDDGVWTVSTAPSFEEVVLTPDGPVDDTPRRLGELVRRELDAARAWWPTVREAAVKTLADGRWLVVPVSGGWVTEGGRVIEPDSASLLAVLPVVLAGSYSEWRGFPPAFRELLAAAGVDFHLLHGGATVVVDEVTTGMIEITGAGSENNKPVAVQHRTVSADDLAGVCDAVAAMIRELPVEHPPMGMPTGASFGYKRTWLAVRDRTVAEVAAAVGLVEGRPVSWDQGVDIADGYGDPVVFVAPPVAGWTLVVNAGVGFHGASTAELSGRLGTEVQFFGNHRVAEYAEWARAVDGRLIRHLDAGEHIMACVETGDPDPGEIAIGFDPAAPGECWPDQDDVLRMAAAWSIDPSTLDVVESAPGDGLLGGLATR